MAKLSKQSDRDAALKNLVETHHWLDENLEVYDPDEVPEIEDDDRDDDE